MFKKKFFMFYPSSSGGTLSPGLEPEPEDEPPELDPPELEPEPEDEPPELDPPELEPPDELVPLESELEW